MSEIKTYSKKPLVVGINDKTLKALKLQSTSGVKSKPTVQTKKAGSGIVNTGYKTNSGIKPSDDKSKINVSPTPTKIQISRTANKAKYQTN